MLEIVGQLEFANESVYLGALVLVVATAVITYIYRFMTSMFRAMDAKKKR